MSQREHQTARVNVDDATWQAFRIRAIQANRSVADELARLVRNDLCRAGPIDPAISSSSGPPAGDAQQPRGPPADRGGDEAGTAWPPDAATRRPRSPDRLPTAANLARGVPGRRSLVEAEIRAIGDAVYDERRVQETVLALMHLNAHGRVRLAGVEVVPLGGHRRTPRARAHQRSTFQGQVGGAHRRRRSTRRAAVRRTVRARGHRHG
jgi:hypothetical protein